jgi:hypothetical protein
VNGRLAARFLYIDDLHAQQTVSIDLRVIRGHGRDNAAFGFDRLVALKADEVGDGLAGLQFGEELNAFVASAKSGRGKKQERGGPL